MTVLILVPLCSLLPGLAEVQRASLAAHAAAREAARVATTSGAVGTPAGFQAARDVVAGHGFDPSAAVIDVTGTPAPDEIIATEVRIRVALVGWVNAPTVTVTARSNGRVDPYGSR